MPKFKMTLTRQRIITETATIEVDAPKGAIAVAKTRLALEKAATDRELAKAGIKFMAVPDEAPSPPNFEVKDSLGRKVTPTEDAVQKAIAELQKPAKPAKAAKPTKKAA